MYYLIYKITNRINGKFYIGAHKTNDKFDNYMGSSIPLKRSIKKYGIKNFTKEILYEASNMEEMYLKEKELVVLDREVSYNIKPGGIGGFDYINQNGLRCERAFLGKKHKEESKEKISKALKNNTHWINKKHKEESKKKIGEKNSFHQIGSGNSQFGKMWITNGTYSRKILKEETIPEGWKKGRVNGTKKYYGDHSVKV